MIHLWQNESMKKNVTAAIVCLLLMAGVNAQKVRTGIYAGVAFAGQKSDYWQISSLPISEGGISIHYGIHFNLPLAKRLELETGIQKVTRGYAYTDNSNSIPQEQYTKIQGASVPVVALVHILDYPEEVPFRFSLGLGAYLSYAVSGKISYEDGTSQKAKFTNAKRTEFGPRWMAKWEFAHKFECYLSGDIRSTNILKNGSGYIKQGSFQAGVGYVF